VVFIGAEEGFEKRPAVVGHEAFGCGFGEVFPTGDHGEAAGDPGEGVGLVVGEDEFGAEGADDFFGPGVEFAVKVAE